MSVRVFGLTFGRQRPGVIGDQQKGVGALGQHASSQISPDPFLAAQRRQEPDGQPVAPRSTHLSLTERVAVGVQLDPHELAQYLFSNDKAVRGGVGIGRAIDAYLPPRETATSRRDYVERLWAAVSEMVEFNDQLVLDNPGKLEIVRQRIEDVRSTPRDTVRSMLAADWTKDSAPIVTNAFTDYSNDSDMFSRAGSLVRALAAEIRENSEHYARNIDNAPLAATALLLSFFSLVERRPEFINPSQNHVLLQMHELDAPIAQRMEYLAEILSDMDSLKADVKFIADTCKLSSVEVRNLSLKLGNAVRQAEQMRANSEEWSVFQPKPDGSPLQPVYDGHTVYTKKN